MRAGVEPGESLAEELDVQLLLVQVDPVEVGDLVFSPGGRREFFCIIDDAVVVEIEAGHAVVALGVLRFFLNGDRAAAVVKLHDTETLGIVDVVSEDRGASAALCALCSCAETFFEAVPGKDVVSKDHGDGVISDEFFTDHEGLRQTVGGGLGLVAQMQAELVPVAQKDLKARQILRRGDDQDLADPGAHQNRDRIVDHRLVVDRQQLLRSNHGQRIEPGAGTAGENDTFHKKPPLNAV